MQTTESTITQRERTQTFKQDLTVITNEIKGQEAEEREKAATKERSQN